jgi:hypothetical protein
VTESIQGLPHVSVRYVVEAEVSMKGLMSSNLRASQNFQAVRVADMSTVAIGSSEQVRLSSYGKLGLQSNLDSKRYPGDGTIASNTTSVRLLRGTNGVNPSILIFVLPPPPTSSLERQNLN